MKRLREALLFLVIGFVAVNILGAALASGESYPPVPMTTHEVIILRVPASSPITP